MIAGSLFSLSSKSIPHSSGSSLANSAGFWMRRSLDDNCSKRCFKEFVVWTRRSCSCWSSSEGLLMSWNHQENLNKHTIGHVILRIQFLIILNTTGNIGILCTTGNSWEKLQQHCSVLDPISWVKDWWAISHAFQAMSWPDALYQARWPPSTIMLPKNLESVW